MTVITRRFPAHRAGNGHVLIIRGRNAGRRGNSIEVAEEVVRCGNPPRDGHESGNRPPRVTKRQVWVAASRFARTVWVI